MKEKGNTPIIVANTMWDLPKTLVNEVKAERMINALLNLAGAKMDYKDLVGDAEVVAYLNPASSAHPLSREVTDIYLYCFKRMMKKRGIDAEEQVGYKIDDLDEYQMHRLNEFKKWIFEKRGGEESNPVINALKEVFLAPTLTPY